MYLKKIEIQGFKSFARKTVLEFEHGIISVVGPNGSGKSNFSDAIRWVLGEQSMKAVRSKKSDDIIFAGSDKKSRLGMAEVVIVFDNEDRRLPLDFSEVSVSRRLFRDGESEYLINGQPVRLMDIVELLSKSGYGNSSYQVISQGTIDQLVLAGPAAIKSLIEEACGIKPYYLKRERTVRKLTRTEQNLLRVKDLVAEIEPRLKSLRRQAKRMEARDELAAELLRLQQSLYAASYRQVSRELAEFENKVKYFDKEIADLSSELAVLEEEIKASETSSAGKSAEYLKLQEDLRALEKDKNKVQEELAIIRGQLKAGVPAGGGDKKSLQLAAGELKNKIVSLASQLEDLQHQIVLGQSNALQHRKIADSFSREIAKLRAQMESARNPFDLSKLKEDIEKVYSRYESLMYQIRNLQTEEDFRQLQEDAGNLEIVLVKLKDRMTQVSSVQFNHNEFVHLNDQLAKLFSQKEKLQSEIAAIEAGVQAASAKKQILAEIAAGLKDEFARVQAEIEKTQSSDPDKHWEELAAKETALAAKLQQYFVMIQKMEGDLKAFLSQETAQKKELLALEREFRGKQDLWSKTKDQRSLVLIEKARKDAILESLHAEVRKNLGNDFIQKIKDAPIAPVEAGLEQKISKLKAQLEALGGVDELTLQEYRETEARYNYLTSQSEDLRKAVDDLKKVIVELDVIIKTQFASGFERINEHFGEYFRILFSGGRAHMGLVKERVTAAADGEGQDNGAEASEKEAAVDMTEAPEDKEKIEVTGIELRATPPGKKLAVLSALSGGERALTSIALLMAILTAFPSPFVVLDEVDAALDEANSIRFGKILARLAHQTQFIIITHNRETMRQAGTLYGVTMGDDGISRVLSLRLDRAMEMAA